MTTSNIIETKKQKFERQKDRLNQQNALIKQMERKQRTRKLIELGGLIIKAKLDHLKIPAMLGGLIKLYEAQANNPNLIKTWTEQGQAAFAKDSQDKCAVIVKFEDQPIAEVRTKLRELGLKWNRFRKEWQGNVKLERLQKVIEGVPNKLTKINYTNA